MGKNTKLQATNGDYNAWRVDSGYDVIMFSFLSFHFFTRCVKASGNVMWSVLASATSAHGVPTHQQLLHTACQSSQLKLQLVACFVSWCCNPILILILSLLHTACQSFRNCTVLFAGSAVVLVYCLIYKCAVVMYWFRCGSRK